MQKTGKRASVWRRRLPGFEKIVDEAVELLPKLLRGHVSTFTETWWRELKESLAQRGVDLDAPDSFSEAQWPEIKETFAERGVDLDALLTRRREIKESLTERYWAAASQLATWFWALSPRASYGDDVALSLPGRRRAELAPSHHQRAVLVEEMLARIGLDGLITADMGECRFADFALLIAVPH